MLPIPPISIRTTSSGLSLTSNANSHLPNCGYLLTWLLSRLDPAQFGSPSAKEVAATSGGARDTARNELPQLTASFTDISPEECEVEPIDYLDGRLGETGSGEPIGDDERD